MLKGICTTFFLTFTANFIARNDELMLMKKMVIIETRLF